MTEEGRRVQWLNHHIDTRNWKAAVELAVTAKELSAIQTAKKIAPQDAVCFMLRRLCLGERERKERFSAAIKHYDWAQAELLARGAEERSDVKDSQVRVELMLTAKAEGRYDDALKYAITKAEQDDINGFAGSGMMMTGSPPQGDEMDATVKIQARRNSR